MTKKFIKSEIIGFVFVCILGTVAHFFYEWLGNNAAVGLFCPINESPWEHLKLIFFPYLLYGAAEIRIMRKSRNLLAAKCAGALSRMVITLAFFYTYSGIIGRNIDWLNILSFFIGVFCAFATDYITVKADKLQSTENQIGALLIIALLTGAFILFTYNPPMIPLFKDPVTATYGI